MDPNHLLTYFETQQQAMLDAIGELVTQETPSDDKGRLDPFAAGLAQRLGAAGAAVTLFPSPRRGNHLRAHYDQNCGSGRPALLLCHYDTVWPVGSLQSHPFRVEEGKAYGPGIFDMQSSLVLVEYLLRAIVELQLRLPRPLVALITSDEEVGSPTSRALIQAEAAQAAYALILESPLPGGVLKTARKGSARFQLQIEGRAAHAGIDPENGVNAIQELAHQILRIHALADLDAGTTINVGVVSGGSRSNVVAAAAHAEIDVRAWTEAELARINGAITALDPVVPGARLQVRALGSRPPLERAMAADLFAQAQTIGSRLGLDLREGRTGGGSDGNLTAAQGVPTLDGLGVPGAGAHADHEHIEIDQIPKRAALLAALLLGLTA